MNSITMFLAMPSLVVHFMLVCVLSFSLAEAGQEEQQRLVSVSLCADAYVLALAKPEEIQALSWQVDHPLSAALPGQGHVQKPGILLNA